jgi:hypothetical protein
VGLAQQREEVDRQERHVEAGGAGRPFEQLRHFERGLRAHEESRGDGIDASVLRFDTGGRAPQVAQRLGDPGLELLRDRGADDRTPCGQLLERLLRELAGEGIECTDPGGGEPSVQRLECCE